MQQENTSLSIAELTYLELTAKYAPNELPGSSAVVQRLVQEMLARDDEAELVESLQARIDDMQDELSELEQDYQDEVRAMTDEKHELQREIEELQEKLDNPDEQCSLCR